MSTNVVLVPSGAVSSVYYVTPNYSVMAGPQVQGGTATLYFGPTPNGPWQQWSAGASLNPASYRALTNSYVYMAAATQAGILAISDIGAGVGPQPNLEQIVNCQGVVASANSTSEVALYSFRSPPGLLRPNFRMRARATVTMTNNANAKTLQVRMNGIGGTLAFQSPALANNANYAFEADWCGIADGATLKGLGAGATGGFGLGTTAVTTLTRDYINNETEWVISCTKATGTDTFQLESLCVDLYQ